MNLELQAITEKEKDKNKNKINTKIAQLHCKPVIIIIIIIIITIIIKIRLKIYNAPFPCKSDKKSTVKEREILCIFISQLHRNNSISRAKKKNSNG